MGEVEEEWGRRRGVLGGSKAPDADPLKKNKGGRQQKNVQNRDRNAEKGVRTSLRCARTHRRLLPASHAGNSRSYFPESAFISPSMCRRAASIL